MGLCALMTGCASPPASDSIPTPWAQSSPQDRTPLAPVRFEGRKGCFELRNGALRVVVAPAVGRIVHLASPNTPNLLNQNPDWQGRLPKRGTRWANIGGDWLWPVAQSHWAAISDGDWPPPPVLGEQPWKAEAWRNADGSQSCVMVRRYGAPVNLVVSRLITLDAGGPTVRIHQRAFSTGPQRVPVTLWNISQLNAPARVFLPADPVRDGGLLSLFPTPPPPERIVAVEDVLVFHPARGGEYKFGTGPADAWVAGQVGEWVLIERSHHKITGPLPDGGCSVEIYANSGLGYAEIELLTPELLLEAGDYLESTLIMECQPLPSDSDDAQAARQVRAWATALAP